MESNIVEEWLRSLNLVQYTQAFFDNGYDDLEICKQIAGPDLDAIGVQKSQDRQELLKAVDSLRDQGATAVYFTLEDIQSGNDSGFQESSDSKNVPSPSRLSRCFDSYDEGENALVSYPKLQLNLMIQNKLREEDITLTDYPYCTVNGDVCPATIQPLALRYAEDFNTHYFDVLQRMDDIRRTRKLLDVEMQSSSCSSPSWEVHSQCIYGSPRGTAPPLPAVPPPAPGCHGETLMRTVTSPRSGHSSGANSPHSDGTDNERKRSSSSGLGKLFRSALRKSSRKYSYKKHDGDLAANEITMPDDERIELMLQVKEGKICLEDAISQVKNYEDVHKKSPECNGKDRIIKRSASYSPSQDKASTFSFFKLQSRRKRKNSGKSSRSRSEESDSRSSISCSPSREINDLSKGGCNLDVFVDNIKTNDLSKQITSLAQSVRQHSYDTNSALPSYLREFSKPTVARSLPNSPSHSATASSTSSVSSVSPLSVRSARCASRNSNCASQYMRKNSAPPSSHHSPERLLARTRSQSPRLRQSQSPSPGSDRKSGSVSPRIQSPLVQKKIGEPPALPPRNKPRDQSPSPRLVHKILHQAQIHCEAMETRSTIESDRSSVQSPLEEDCRSISTMSVGSDTSPIMDRKNRMLDRIRNRSWRSTSSGGEEVNSSDYEDHDELDKKFERTGIQRDSFSEKFKNDVRQKFSQMQANNSLQNVDVPVKSSSGESLPSSSGGNKRSHSSTSTEEDLSQAGIINTEKALVGGTPQIVRRQLRHSSKKRSSKRSKPRTVEDLLKRLGLESLNDVFASHDYNTLEAFSELESADLDELNITSPEQRAKLLTAAELVQDVDYETPDSPELTPRNQFLNISPRPACDTPRRDSGCYASSENLKDRSPTTTANKTKKTDIQEIMDMCTQTNNTLEKLHKKDSLNEDKENQPMRKNPLSPKPQLKPKPVICSNSSSESSSTPTSPTKVPPPVPKKPKPQAPSRSVSLNQQRSSPITIITSLSSPSSPVVSPLQRPVTLLSPPQSSQRQQTGQRLRPQVLMGQHVVLQSFKNVASPPVSPQMKIRTLNIGTPPASPRVTRANPAANLLSPKHQSTNRSPRGSRPVSFTLENLVVKKLEHENIDLTQEPYTDMAGFCGLPPALVLRYAEELGRQDIRDMASAMELVRCHRLKNIGKLAVPDDNLGESCINPVYDNIYSSVGHFLIMNGLPMYKKFFYDAGYRMLESVKDLSNSQLKTECHVTDQRHVCRLMAAIDALRFYIETKSTSCPHHWKGTIDITDRV